MSRDGAGHGAPPSAEEFGDRPGTSSSGPGRSSVRPGLRSIMLLQTVSPDYRQPVWHALAEHSGVQLTVVAGPQYFTRSTITRHGPGVPLLAARNRFLFGRRLLVQWLPLRALVSADVVVAEFNPRILSTWILAALRRVGLRRTVFWGHALSRHGSSGSARFLRRLLAANADALIVYSVAEREAAIRDRLHSSVVVARNGLLRASDIAPRPPDAIARDFIYVGRLVSEKRPGLLIEGFLDARPHLGTTAKLIVVGEGPLRASLEARVRRARADDAVEFWGHVSDLERLRSLYRRAIASISPGYVGLSIIQSFGFGVPMIIADNEPHSPEIEAAIPQINSVFFSAGSAESLSAAIVDMARQASSWCSRANCISRECRDRYSADAMAHSIFQACCGEPTNDVAPNPAP